MRDSWGAPKPERFRRDTANVTFHTVATPRGAMERAGPIILGLSAGLTFGLVYWFASLWFAG